MIMKIKFQFTSDSRCEFVPQAFLLYHGAFVFRRGGIILIVAAISMLSIKLNYFAFGKV
jgi:hypothetical protein